MRRKRRKPNGSKKPSRSKSRRLWVLGAAVALEGLPVWLHAHRPGGSVVVRCRQGHLFTTIWIPSASIKALRLGPWRVQRCPLGPHWSAVTPAKVSELIEDELRTAREHHDLRLP